MRLRHQPRRRLRLEVRERLRAVSRPLMAVVAALVVVAAAGYWWMNRPPGRYKPDNSGLYPINVNGKFGFMDRSGKTVITPQFDGTVGFSEGLAYVRVGTKYGYINTKGVLVITPQFDDAMLFRYGRAAVKLCCGFWFPQKPGDRYGFIDKDGKYICSPDFSWVGQFSGDLAPVRTAGGVLAFVNRSGKVVMAGKFDGLRPTGFTAGIAAAASSGKWGFIDTTGKWVIDPQFESALDFADGPAPVMVGGRWGYIDQKGKFVVNPQYDSGGEFFEGLAVFRQGDKLGLIDTKGRVVVDAKFLLFGQFSDGLAPVKTEDGWGFIDRTGKMVVRAQFDGAGDFQNGLAQVWVLGKEAYITTAGAFVVDPFPGTTVPKEKARRAAEAADAAAKAAETAAQAKTADRSRVEQGIAGEWVGTSGAHANDRVTITSKGGVIGAVLLSDRWREVLQGQLLDDNHLLLTGTSVTRPAAYFGAYSLDTFALELSADGNSLTGNYHDAAGHAGPIAMRKSLR
jgi:hypothetical protein